MTTYDLHAAVSNVLETTSLTDPAEIAAKVAEDVPAKAVRATLAESLAVYVRVQIGSRRRSNAILDSEKHRKQSARSSKVAGIRDAWSAALRDRVHVESGWKLLGECTYDDLVYAAAERQELARRNAAQAEKYELLATKLQAAGVDRVADLPQVDLTELGAAA